MTHKIIGIGNAIMDFLCNINDNFLLQNNLNKGSMTLINKSHLSFLNQLNIEKFSSGGSVANTINTLSQLGNNCYFIGSVGSDLAGQQYIKDLQNTGTKFIGHTNSNQDTALSYILISPDGQRTMCTYLGCSPVIDENHIQAHYFVDAKIFYIEGYLWDISTTIKTIKNSIQIAKKQGCKIAFSLSDAFCVMRHRHDFIELIKNDIDILFANETEILSLSDSLQYSSNFIKNFINELNSKIILAVTRHENGSEVFYQNDYISVPTQSIIAFDSTGAGDSFACGFLHGFVRNFELKRCAEIGNLIAGLIIQKMGARFEIHEISNLKI